ncbi:Signal transduction histidine kinase [Saccharopolyspora shandongensis]|uniref:histidine kinase n=1 Tax=Saccharopolyspora shandongensis TaxID=418495 RepID=A0A1H3J4S8_9PSEU|nr:histidine kinase [Saccharopolyspora shandongensis]SDY34951.1 Signal transduction histidine kinase [Saccharopolyspora shandongensis]
MKVSIRDVLWWLVLSAPVLLVNQVAAADPFSGWEIALGVGVVGITVLLRRARPLVAAGIALAAWAGALIPRPEAGAVAAFAFTAMLVATSYNAGFRVRRHRDALIRLALAAGVLSLLVLVLARDVGAWLVTLIGALLFALIPWLLGRHHQKYRALVRAGWERAEQLERQQQIVGEQARLQERTRIAGDMHDLLGHQLSLIALRIGALEVAPSLDAGHREAAGQARASVTEAAERLREVVEVLRDDSGPVTGESVAELVEQARAAGMAVTLSETGEVAQSMRARAVCRIVQEALTNAAKHAPGAAVTVEVRHTDDESEVSVANPLTDDREPASGGGYGLVALAERVRLAGGTFQAGPERGRFLLSARIPQVAQAIAASDSAARLARAEGQVRSSRNIAVAAAAASAVLLGLLTVNITAFDTITSVLPSAAFDRMQIGQSRSSIEHLLPARTKIDDPPDGDLPPPPGTSCSYYSTHHNPFDERRGDLYRLCFRQDVLVDKDYLQR